VQRPFTFEISRDEGRVTVVPSGELDMAGTLKLEPALDDVLRDAPPDLLVVDLRDVDFIDSVGLRLLVTINDAASSRGSRMAIVRGNRDVHRMFEVTGYDELLPLVADPAEL
jgi:anti-sigma B factor antagonist